MQISRLRNEVSCPGISYEVNIVRGVCVCLQATATQCCLQLKDDAKFRSLSKRDLSNYSLTYEIVDPSQAKDRVLDSYHTLYRQELSHLVHFHTTLHHSVVIVHEKNDLYL